MDWVILDLDRNGRLVEDGYEVNIHWPAFETIEEAEGWLETEDVRATVRARVG